MNQKRFNNNNNQRKQLPPPFSRFKCIPKRWLSSAEHGNPIQCESIANLFFIPMKTPLTNFLSKFLNQQEPWTPANAIKQVKAMINPGSNPHFLAVNVSLSSEILNESDWEAVSASYCRCPIPKNYEKNSIDSFCDIINKELTKISNPTIPHNSDSLVCLIYSGCGHNRVGFSIAAYLSRNCKELELGDSLKRVDAASPNLIYRQKPLDTLSTIFKTSSQIHGHPPDGIDPNDEVRPLPGIDIGIPLEKYAGLKKVSKKRVIDERDEVLGILADAFDDESILRDNAFPSFSPTIWNSDSMAQLRSNVHYITFEPRGQRSFVVINKENRVFIVVPIIPNNINYATCNDETIRPHNDIYELKAKSTVTSPPAVCSSYLIEERKRTVILTTDLLLLNNVRTFDMTLQQRLSYLYHQFTTKLRPDSLYFNNMMNNNNQLSQNEQQMQMQMQNQNGLNSNCQIHFVYRPVARLANFERLRKDLNSKLFVKCDGINFINDSAPPLTSLLLPIQPSIILLFDYNGSNKSILYALNDHENPNPGDPTQKEFPLVPLAVYVAKKSKYNELDGRTSRFEFDKEKRRWKPVSIGYNDPPTTLTEINTIVRFIDSKFQIDDAFVSEIEKIARNYDI